MIKEKAEKALRFKEKYTKAYNMDSFDEGKKYELKYLALRKEILDEVDADINKQKSIPIKIVKNRISEMPIRLKIKTGITALDNELVTEEEKVKGVTGGFSIGNFIQIVGSRATGKSSLMLKIVTTFSMVERVCWMDFEMGEKRVVEKLKAFSHHDDNLLYYNSSRSLEEIVNEIKFLNASGVNHFVIDSTMKISLKKVRDKYDRFALISQELSNLTSTLGINIYLINQMSQGSEKDGVLAIKHGNDAEYDADYIFYILKMKKTSHDDFGQAIYDERYRVIKCTKNREDDRTFSVKIDKNCVFQEQETICV